MKKFSLVSKIILLSALLVSCGQRQKISNVEEESHDHSEEISLTEEQMKAVGINLGNVESRDLNSVIRVNGQLSLDPQRRAEITSLINGVVSNVLVTDGKYISAGQPVASITSMEIIEMQKNYLILKKETLTAEQELNRQQELSAQDAGVQKTLQNASAQYEISKAQLAGLEKQLILLSINPQQISAGNLVTQIPLRSPIAGYVGKVNVSTGSFVNTQTSLMYITDNSDIHCDMKIYEKDINLVEIGQSVNIVLTNQKSTVLTGEIYQINKSFDDETKAITVHASIKPATPNTKLIPGMYVTGVINTGKNKSAAVPNDAIVSRDGKQFIFALQEEEVSEDGKSFHFAAVEVISGVSELGYTQITPVDKLADDAQIVLSNAFYLGSMSVDHGEHNH
ncbi:MAG: efflux RND transporter periplasmic adaptor subunit [Dysgonamonadaceae bacterium]|jgi:cobalt-zinc-cadmium efflux system membrane fusion protein|nr:efflux RND transporter periplasmic adaptor subunit [Dysgonamonadaceae bacterium]